MSSAGFATFKTNLSKTNGNLQALGAATSTRAPRVPLLPRDDGLGLDDGVAARVAILKVIDPGTVYPAPLDGVSPATDTSPALIQDLRDRAAAKLQVHGTRDDRENSLAYRDRRYRRHVLDEAFLRKHVWDACLRPLATEEDLVYLTQDSLPPWLQVLPKQAESLRNLYSSPHAVVGLRLSDVQQTAIRKLQIDVSVDIEDSTGPDESKNAERPPVILDSDFLPVMVCMTTANIQRDGENHHPSSGLLLDQAFLQAYSSATALRKLHAHVKSQVVAHAPSPPPLLLGIFTDNFLDVYAIEDLDGEEMKENKEMPYHCTRVGIIAMGKHAEIDTFLRVWQFRHAATALLKRYMEAVTPSL